MKDGDGPPIMFAGGAELLATATKAGLIDEYRLLIAGRARGRQASLRRARRAARAAPDELARDTVENWCSNTSAATRTERTG